MAQKLSQNWGLLFLALAALCRSLCQTFVRTPPSAPWPLPQALRRWRQAFLSINHGLDPTVLVSSIFLGEAKACPRPVLVRFLPMRLSHLLAARGFNCWIVRQMLAWPPALWPALGGKVNRWDAIASVAGAGFSGAGQTNPTRHPGTAHHPYFSDGHDPWCPHPTAPARHPSILWQPRLRPQAFSPRGVSAHSCLPFRVARRGTCTRKWFQPSLDGWPPPGRAPRRDPCRPAHYLAAELRNFNGVLLLR